MELALSNPIGVRPAVLRTFAGPAELNWLKYDAASAPQQVRVDLHSKTVFISGTANRDTQSKLSLTAGGRTVMAKDFVLAGATAMQTAKTLVAKLPWGFSADFTSVSADAVELQLKYTPPTRAEVRAGMRAAQHQLATARLFPDNGRRDAALQRFSRFEAALPYAK